MTVYSYEEFMKMIEDKKTKQDYPKNNINLPPEKRKPKEKKK